MRHVPTHDSLFQLSPLLLLLISAASPTGLPAQNLLRNPSFEQFGKTGPTAWKWSPGRAHAEMNVDTNRARSGKASVRISNATPRAPHVYGHLTQTVPVRKGATYTLSCYVWTQNGGTAWIGGGKKWQFRFPFPKKTDGWQRVTGTFTADDTSFTVRILTESPTPGIWIDDVQLEQGTKATPFHYVPPLVPGECRLDVTPYEPPRNLAPNPSFEIIDGVRPKFWMWDKRNTDAVMRIDDSDAHSGRYSVFFTNHTPFAPQVYGWFGVTGGVPIEPDTIYTISAYVKSENPGAAWIGGGRNWRIRCHFRPTGRKWMRFQKTFRTLPDERTFPLMIVTESPTPGFHVDDIRLEKGPRATPFIPDAERNRAHLEIRLPPPPVATARGRVISTAWAPSRYPRDTYWFTTGEVRFTAEGFLPAPPGKATISARLLNADGKAIIDARRETTIDHPAFAANAAMNPGDVGLADLTIEVLVTDHAGKKILAARRAIRIVTPKAVRQRLDKVAAERTRLAPLVDALDARGVGAYARIVLTTIDNFVPWIHQDLDHGKVDRAWDQAALLEKMARKQIADARAVLAGKRPGLVVPRYQTSPIAISGPSFIATRKFPDGRRERGPVFFVGYGHFGQVRRDVGKFPGYGCNLIQIEFGPRSVLPHENDVRLDAIEEFLDVCDRAAKANVAVNLLLSPHYFPDWALRKWPWLTECHGGFFRYCVHAPESRSVLEKSLRTVIPRIRKHPALHSLCLSNEPICVDLTGCRVSRKTWPEWLRKRYGGNISALNARWGAKYARFDDIPIPPPEFTPGANIYDFVLFNQETFAAFHRWMADVIHSMAPTVPVHAKIMMSAHFRRSLHGVWSVSPELFARLSQINGNDCCCWYHARGEFASDGPVEAMAYDFQRSMADLPVFNSENHVIIDRDHDVIPPAHIYSTLWQGAIHGQSATTIWVWERTYDPVSALAGSILHRPDCVAAAGRACLDLNRLANEVTAFQNLPPRIVFFWSLASIVQGTGHDRRTTAAYRAADFLGVPLGFVTERQLARFAAGEDVRPLRSARVVVTAGAEYVPDSALAGLKRFVQKGGKLVTIGKCFTHDEHGRSRRSRTTPGARLTVSCDDEHALFAEFAKRLPEWGVVPPATLVSSDSRRLFGIEYRTVKTDGGLLINACNYLRTPQTAYIALGPVAEVNPKGKPRPDQVPAARRHPDRVLELIESVPVRLPVRLHPLHPVLLRIED